MRFKKIKAGSKGVELQWETTNKQGDAENHDVTPADAPMEDFTKAMAKLAPLVTELLGIGETYASKVTITKLSFDFNDDPRRAVVISGTAPVHGTRSPFNLHTPRIVENGEDGGEPVIDEIFEAIALVEKEAIRYYNGHRVQLSIDDEAA